MSEEWSRDYALNVLKENVSSLDGEYDDENEVFFDIRFGDDSLVAKVTDATDESVEEFIINFQ